MIARRRGKSLGKGSGFSKRAGWGICGRGNTGQRLGVDGKYNWGYHAVLERSLIKIIESFVRSASSSDAMCSVLVKMRANVSGGC